MRFPAVTAQPGVTVVTANALVAAAISTEYTRKQIKAGFRSWERPHVVTLSAWMAELWQQRRHSSRPVPNLLSRSQELFLWERLFSAELPELFDHRAAAVLAVAATRLIGEWQLPLDHEAWSDYADAGHFHRLHGRFRRECERRQCITRSDLWRLLPEWLAEEPKQINFAGFAEKSPGLNILRRALGPKGSFCDTVLPKAGRTPKSFEYDSFSDELVHVARWTRARLEADENSSIGILICDLATHRSRVKQVFEEVFAPSPQATDTSDALHLAGSNSLLSEPVIVAACLLLELATTGGLPVDEASALLRSPFLPQAAEERNQRALSDLRLRSRRDLQVSLGQLERHTSTCNGLQRMWRTLRQNLPEIAGTTMALAAWSDWISDLLQQLEWPGTGALTVSEQKVLEGWNEALNDLAALSLVSGDLPWSQAYANLREALRTAGGVESGDWLSPVQVLDADAATGLTFDAVALTGFSEGNWPSVKGAQPFIPMRLQRAAGMPGGHWQDAAAARSKQAVQLLRSGRDVVVTFTGALTPLLAQQVTLPRHALPGWPGSLATDIFPPAELERLTDEAGPPLPVGETPPGGVSILKAQSACPFQAFARYRLRAESLEGACFGLDARDRGGYVHKALEHVWRQLKDSTELQRADEEKLDTVIAEAVRQTVNDIERGAFHQAVHETERTRLAILLREWLALEKTRLQPFAVEYTEEKLAANIEGLPLNVRIDRIDRLADGSVLLIDYKTGMPSAKQLLGDRPEEPQLLVYAEAIDADVAGVFFGQVRARDVKADGLALTAHFPATSRARNKDAKDWPEERMKSAQALRAIAREFVDGFARVSPRKGACTFCGLNGLCRIAESGDAGEEESDES